LRSVPIKVHIGFDWLILAESHPTKRLFAGTVRRMEALPLPAGQVWQPGKTNLDGGEELREGYP